MIKLIKNFTPKFLRLSQFGNNPFRLLDIGAGNHSATKYKIMFPNCEYHGVDLDKNYNNDEQDFKCMVAFYEMDLTKLDFSSIPENYFDFIMMSHIIEHLHNGDKVIECLIPKLKSGGYIYIEYPGETSTRLPSMNGTLNFYDDDTHVRVYSVMEIEDVLKKDFEIISSGKRRNLLFLIAMPFRILVSLVQFKVLNANVFWDLLGFAEYVYAKKL